MQVRTALVRIVMQVNNASKSSIASKESNASMSQCPTFIGSMAHGVPESLESMTHSP